MTTPLWRPSPQAITESQMGQFMTFVNSRHQQHFKKYTELHQWSVDHPSQFWSALWEFCKVVSSHPADEIMLPHEKMQKTTWFQGARLNFAENLLKHRSQDTAIIFTSENDDYRTMTYDQLWLAVAAVSDYLRTLGVKAGDRVAGFLPNQPETVVAMLATTSIGAIWSSCSPDFGLQGLVDRFSQIKPSVLFAVDGHIYKGKTFHHIEKIKQCQQQLPSLTHTIVVPYVNKNPDITGLDNAAPYSECIKSTVKTIAFEQLPFDHPVYILYTSGTTGKPKCMVHGAGGTLLQHLKELMLHTDLRAQQRIFFNTTCGWMMWNWLVSSLAVGATIVLYDGAPFYPTYNVLFDLIDKAKINVFGIGAKFLEFSEKRKLIPKKTHQLSSLQCILTTGSPLLPNSFDYAYKNIKSNMQLSSISGGSDIVSCFALGNPILPVYKGELQCIGLGMNVKIVDETGHCVVQEKGELVCTTPFPSMPVYFWNDPNGEKYQQAYFSKFPGVWAHGDYAEITEHGGMIIYGRSDATLNPRGIRIGTAEIYHQVDKIDEVLDSLAISQDWKTDERIILFVVLREHATLNAALIKKIKTRIRENASPHHVPKKIIQVPDLPRTLSGKTAELAVKKIIHHEPVSNTEALANPEVLAHFQDIDALKN